MSKRRASAGVAVASGAAAAAAVGGVSSGADGLPLRHCFLQAMMARQYVRESEAKRLYRQITDAANDAGYLGFLADVNTQLNFAQFELRRSKYPGDDKWYVGFVNREADEASKRSAKYRGAKDGKPDTRVTAYFRTLLDYIVAASSPEGLGHLTSQQALYITVSADVATQGGEEEAAAVHTQAQEVAKLGMKERETALAQLSADGWLAHVPDQMGCYTLGPRSFLELSHTLEGLAQ